MKERWKRVTGFPAYEASDKGRVRSYWKQGGFPGSMWHVADEPQRFLNPSIDEAGRPKIALVNEDGEKKQTFVGEAVLLAFVGEKPDGLIVCHNNDDPTDNRLENLRYDTHQSNQRDRLRNWRQREEPAVISMRQARDAGVSIAALAVAFSDYEEGHIRRICNGNARGNWGGPIVKHPRRTKGGLLITPSLRKLMVSQLDEMAGTEVAEMIGVDNSTVSRWKTGSRGKNGRCNQVEDAGWQAFRDSD